MHPDESRDESSIVQVSQNAFDRAAWRRILIRDRLEAFQRLIEVPDFPRLRDLWLVLETVRPAMLSMRGFAAFVSHPTDVRSDDVIPAIDIRIYYASDDSVFARELLARLDAAGYRTGSVNVATVSVAATDDRDTRARVVLVGQQGLSPWLNEDVRSMLRRWEGSNQAVLQIAVLAGAPESVERGTVQRELDVRQVMALSRDAEIAAEEIVRSLMHLQIANLNSAVDARVDARKDAGVVYEGAVPGVVAEGGHDALTVRLEGGDVVRLTSQGLLLESEAVPVGTPIQLRLAWCREAESGSGARAETSNPLDVGSQMHETIVDRLYSEAQSRYGGASRGLCAWCVDRCESDESRSYESSSEKHSNDQRIIEQVAGEAIKMLDELNELLSLDIVGEVAGIEDGDVICWIAVGAGEAFKTRLPAALFGDEVPEVGSEFVRADDRLGVRILERDASKSPTREELDEEYERLSREYRENYAHLRENFAE